MQVIMADLLTTDQFDLVEQNLDIRFSDTYTATGSSPTIQNQRQHLIQLHQPLERARLHAQHRQ